MVALILKADRCSRVGAAGRRPAGLAVASVAACTHTNTSVNEALPGIKVQGQQTPLCRYHGRTALAPQAVKRYTIEPEKVRADANSHKVDK